MERMGAEELRQYATLLGVEPSAAKTKDDLIGLIERRREKRATVSALGLDLEIPMKRASDKRVSDLLQKAGRTDEETDEAMRLLLGDEQHDALVEAATDEDGTVDSVALGVAFVKVMTSDELKNS